MGSLFSLIIPIYNPTYFDTIPIELVEVIFSYLSEVDNLNELDIIRKVNWGRIWYYKSGLYVDMRYENYRGILMVYNKYKVVGMSVKGPVVKGPKGPVF